MSIQTTYSVTREFAIAAIEKKLEDGVNDEQLADMLEIAVHNGFYNFHVCSEEALEIERIGGYPILEDLDNLPEYNDAY